MRNPYFAAILMSVGAYIGRHALRGLLGVWLALHGAIAGAFEIEESRSYPAIQLGATSVALRILSTADVDVFDPIIRAFQSRYPRLQIQYDVAGNTEVMRAVAEEGAAYDLVISSAMDLQAKLANDGYARRYVSDATLRLPDWANWRGELFAFTQEPAVLILSEAAFDGIALPRTREELIALLRDRRDLFVGRVGTYDVRSSGLGYLFATQDSRNTEAYWRLTEVMGRLQTRLYCCSAEMIRDVADGRLAMAYNVLGSYARARLIDTPGIVAIELEDFVSVTLRTALIPKSAQAPAEAGLLIDFLADLHRYPDLIEQSGLAHVGGSARAEASAIRPIRLGPGLLVFLDKMRRESFLRSWTGSILQQ